MVCLELKKVGESIASVAGKIESEEGVKEMVKLLSFYQGKPVGGTIAETLDNTQSEETRIEIAGMLKKVEYMSNSDFKIFTQYLELISDNIPKSINDSLSMKDINKITETYNRTIDPWRGEDKTKVKKEFFTNLNNAMENGKTIDDKIEIMNNYRS